MRVEEKASEGILDFQFTRKYVIHLTCSCPKGSLFTGDPVRHGIGNFVEVLLTSDTSVEVRIGGVLWWVVCKVFFVFRLLVDNPVETNGD